MKTPEQIADELQQTQPLNLTEREMMVAAIEADRAQRGLADALITVEQIADEIAGHPIGSGYYQTTVGVDGAREMAEAVLALLNGESSE